MEEKKDTLIQTGLRIEAIEQQMAIHYSLLASPGQPGLDGPLTDSEGFPVPSYDHYAIRNARMNYHRLANDLRKERQTLAIKLQDLHSSGPPVVVPRPPKKEATPFAVVGAVTEGSPAYTAGIREGDQIVAISSAAVFWDPIKETLSANSIPDNLINLSPSEIFNLIPSLIIEGKIVPFILWPAQTKILKEVLVTPSKWNGKGLLGCKLDKL